MAGIGFELKKLFNKRGVGNLLKAYGYTGVVTAGPMILGIMYLLGIAYVGKVMGLDKHNRELVNSMVTYALLSSMILTGIFSTALTRYWKRPKSSITERTVLESARSSKAIMS